MSFKFGVRNSERKPKTTPRRLPYSVETCFSPLTTAARNVCHDSVGALHAARMFAHSESTASLPSPSVSGGSAGSDVTSA